MVLYLSAKGKDGVCHLSDILLLVQVNGLENVDIVDTVCLESLLEAVTKMK